MEYLPTIGLEIHAELKTRTKMFCDSLNDPDEKTPNRNICPVCTGQPGTLPTINKEAIAHMVRVGLALNGTIANRTKFDRKNYFYPDLPKGYQISQYDEPIVSAGKLMGIRVTRVHLEEDAGRLIHGAQNMKHGTINADDQVSSFKIQDATYVDYNRAGLPLMELVTEPDIVSAPQARAFAENLQRILRYLGASDADMEKGQMRVEANVSLHPVNDARLGTKVEVKNINSFKAVEAAINFEIARQAEILENGGKIVQETRGWDDVKLVTFSQRLKEQAHDYRYFPEPDLPPMALSESGIDIEKLKRELPELPDAKRERFIAEYGFNYEQAENLVADKADADYVEAAISELKTEEGGNRNDAAKLLYNYFTSDFRGLLAETGMRLKEAKITPENFADLIMLIIAGRVSSRSAKDILRKMAETGADPRDILQSEGLEQVSDADALKVVAEKVIAANEKVVADYKKGKVAALQALIGRAMGELKGRANPAVLKSVFERLLQ